MDELFVAAMESLLELYGSSGILEQENGTQTTVRISPLFPAKLAAEPDRSGARYVAFESSVLIQFPDGTQTDVLPFKTTLIRENTRYTVCTVSPVPGNAFELGIKR